MLTATYSPDDNKLRLYSTTRLDPDTYARVRAAGFIWAPKQDLFVAPTWTPNREDLLIELAGQIDDEDTSLSERAEERADRFDDYQDKRRAEAERARATVSAIADNIPLGQPILVGHHSERHARKDAERIENGMRRAVKLWETSKYWQSRAAGAIRHAKYKELPAVRHRRIKGIEADKRKQERYKADAARYLAAFERVDHNEAWTLRDDGTLPTRQERGYFIAGRLSGGPYMVTVRDEANPAHAFNYGPYDVLAPDDKRYQRCPAMTVDDVIAKLRTWVAQTSAYCGRWIAHYDNRIAYERAMLGDAGGIITDKTDYPIVPGGRVLVRNEWLIVIKVNRKDGKICSVSTNSRYVRVKGIEEVTDYQPPTAEAAKAIKARKLPPMINRDSPGARHMTQVEYTRMCNDYKGTKVATATEEHGAYRYRTAFSGGGSFSVVPVFLTDAKVHELPPPADTPRPQLPAPEPAQSLIDQADRLRRANDARAAEQADAAPFDTLRESLKTGIQIVSTPQLFPTPAAIASRVIDLADIAPGHRVLEPSAGTGSLIGAMGGRMFRSIVGQATREGAIVAVEINYTLAEHLRREFPLTEVVTGDFLEQNGNLGKFDRIVMNPPFSHGADIRHIQHARRMLAPGGKLVAICGNGPRQQAAFEGDADAWIDLPAGTFAGTEVRAAIVVLREIEQ